MWGLSEHPNRPKMMRTSPPQVDTQFLDDPIEIGKAHGKDEQRSTR